MSTLHSRVCQGPGERLWVCGWRGAEKLAVTSWMIGPWWPV